MKGVTTIRMTIVSLAVHATAALGAPCQPTTLSVDVALADTAAFAFQCRGMAQTFVAPDTLIAAITVWRPPSDFLDYRARDLYVLGTFPGGDPDPSDLLYGPTSVSNLSSDTLNALPYRFAFDPPLALPHRGVFAFVVQAGDAESWLLSASNNDPYPAGVACTTGPVFACARPGAATCYEAPWLDLCFSIEFCNTVAVGTISRSWGKLKILYR
jgi:hypothetical protein